MFIILSIIGLLAAAWVWENVNPIAGVVVGFLFVGGLGWNVLGALLNLLKPSARNAYGPDGKEFIAAWEERFGTLFPGGSNHPPPRTFQRWLRDKRTSGLSAAEWLHTQMFPRPVDRGLGTASHLRPPNPGRAKTSSVFAWCEVISESPDAKYPLTILRVTEDGFILKDVSGSGTFADIAWTDIYSWQRRDEHERGGNWVWLLIPFDGPALPDDVVGLAIREPNHREEWEALLNKHMPDDIDEEE